jgi:hypothetical protein
MVSSSLCTQYLRHQGSWQPSGTASVPLSHQGWMMGSSPTSALAYSALRCIGQSQGSHQLSIPFILIFFRESLIRCSRPNKDSTAGPGPGDTAM